MLSLWLLSYLSKYRTPCNWVHSCTRDNRYVEWQFFWLTRKMAATWKLPHQAITPIHRQHFPSAESRYAGFLVYLLVQELEEFAATQPIIQDFGWISVDLSSAVRNFSSIVASNVGKIKSYQFHVYAVSPHLFDICIQVCSGCVPLIIDRVSSRSVSTMNLMVFLSWNLSTHDMVLTAWWLEVCTRRYWRGLCKPQIAGTGTRSWVTLPPSNQQGY